jgi:WD40 repeat protein
MRHVVFVVLGAAALALLTPDPSGAQHRRPAWRVWGTLGSDDNAYLTNLAFAPGTMTLAGGQDNGKVYLWHAGTGRDEGLLEARELKAILALHFDAPGNRLLAAGENGVRGWKAPGGQLVLTFDWKDAPVSQAVFSADGQTVACASAAGAIELWTMASGTVRSKLPIASKGFVTSLAFSPDGAHLAVGCSDGVLQLWQTSEGKLVSTLQQAGAGLVRGLAFSPDGQVLASVRGREPVTLWQVAAGKVLKHLPVALPPYFTLAFSPRGDALAAGNGSGTVQVWTVPDGTEQARFKGHGGAVMALAFTPTGRMLASSSTAMIVRVYDRHRFLKLPEIKYDPVELARLLKDLQDDSEIKGSRALLALTASPAQALPLLKTKLRHGQKPDLAKLEKLLGDLKSEQFIIRDKATKALKAMGQSIRPELRRWLELPLDLETQRRVEQLLTPLVQEKLAPAERLLTKRATVLLERVGGKAAREMLEGLLWGVPDDDVITEVRAALERLQ